MKDLTKAKKAKKGFWGRIVDKLDKKIQEKANSGPCCCAENKSEKKSCCS